MNQDKLNGSPWFLQQKVSVECELGISSITAAGAPIDHSKTDITIKLTKISAFSKKRQTEMHTGDKSCQHTRQTQKPGVV